MTNDKVFPWFKFNARDFIRDPRYTGLSLEEKGLFTWLLCMAWDSYDGRTIPDDRKKLAALLSTRIKVRTWEAVRKLFEVDANSRLFHPELMAERTRAEVVSEERAVAGRLGGLKTQANVQANAGHPFPANGIANASTDTEHLLKRLTVDGEREKKNSNGTVLSKNSSETTRDQLFDDVRRMFPEARREWVEEVFSQHGRESIAKQLEYFPRRKFSDGGRNKWALFRKSLEGDWDAPVTLPRRSR